MVEAACHKKGPMILGVEWKRVVSMPDDLLRELELAVPVAKNLEVIEDLLRVVIREARWAAACMKGSARAFEAVWQRIVVDVAKGKSAEMQEARSRLLSVYESRLHQLKHTHVLVSRLAALGTADLPPPDALVPEIEGMERLKARVLDRWQSAEDLERLAVEHYPLAQSQLEKIAATHTPPAEWYQGEEEQLF
jgi:metal-responsive CopG/Arc/MetJ family transcriptional regulator